MAGKVSSCLLEIYCDPTSKETLQRQIIRQLRDAITSSRLQPGAPLPPSRKLAAQLQLSRNTIVLSYEQLISEGYLETKVGSGVYVVSILPEHYLIPCRKPTVTTSQHRSSASISARGQRVLDLSPMPYRGGGLFSTSEPETLAFPFAAFAKLAQDTLRHPRREFRDYSGEAGYVLLRQAIVAYLGAFRGVPCRPDNIVITTGTTQSLHLMAQLLLDPGDAAWVEDPSNRVARAALAAASATIVPVPVDNEGIDVAEGMRRAPDARVAIVTPDHQYPLGMILSAARREQLLDWARTSGSWIIEDDYDGEFRYSGEPIPALKSLDFSDNVIYLGTFSKVTFPGLRLGYMVLPDVLIEPAKTILRALEHSPTLLLQPAVAAFMERGLFGPHVRAMTKIYRERQGYIVAACQRHLAGLLKVEPQQTGLHLAAWFDGPLRRYCDRNIHHRLSEFGFGALPISAYYHDPDFAPRGLLLGFANMTELQIERAAQRLSLCLVQCMNELDLAPSDGGGSPPDQAGLRLVAG